MHAKPRLTNPVALLLGLAGLLAGCGALTPRLTADALPVSSKAYDLPSNMDPNVMTRMVANSFWHVLKTPPAVTEGAMPDSLPLTPFGFYVEDKILTFDLLGSVHFPQAVCPHSLAMIEGLHSGSQAVYRYTACMEPYRDGVRLYLVQTKAAFGFTDSAASSSASFSDLLTQLAASVIKALPNARVASADRGSDVDSTSKGTDSGERRVAQDSSGKSRSFGTSRAHEVEAEIKGTSPLICLTPDRNEIVVRSLPGEGRIVGTVTSGLAIGDNSPLDGAYIHVRTDQGLAGWAQRSDLHWSSCPIG
ncbi:MAG: hypothetical protein GDA68_04170 [Nitrospira sp. CR2.1]|nr:hypothetical protein [Nitrospira sp. CR2.1]